MNYLDTPLSPWWRGVSADGATQYKIVAVVGGGDGSFVAIDETGHTYYMANDQLDWFPLMIRARKEPKP